MDYAASASLSGSDSFSDIPLDREAGIPIYRSASKLVKFRKLNCPPFSSYIVISKFWQEIILNFVPSDRVQFFPVRLFAADGVTDEFSWILPFDKVKCIDIERSEIIDRVQKPGVCTILQMNRFWHMPRCMDNKHLARDLRMRSHLLVSDALKEALSATGEGDVFYKPEALVGHYMW